MLLVKYSKRLPLIEVIIACVINEHGVMLQTSSYTFDLSGLLDLIKGIPLLRGIVEKLSSYGYVMFTGLKR